MCSIIASYSKDKFKELVDLNQFRGTFSYSYTELDDDNTVNYQEKDFGPFPTETVSDEGYKIGHVQAPTGGTLKEADRIHPVRNDGGLLWHNGLIQPSGIKFLQKELNTTETFDTKLLAMYLVKAGFNGLSRIDGLFSCLYQKGGNFFVFRTKHGKLHVDDNLSISSERFEGSKCINADTIYKLDFSRLKLREVHKFKTKRFNQIIRGEM